MKIFLLICIVICAPLLAQQGESLSDRRLMEIVSDQQRILELAERGAESDGTVTESIEQQVRQLSVRWESYVSDHPDDVEARILYGKFLRVFGEVESAIVQFLAADGIEPNLPVVKQQIGNYYAEHGLYEEALKAFIQAVELAPTEPTYHYQLGELLYTFKESMIADEIYSAEVVDSEMLRAFQTSAELMPEDLSVQMRYAEAFYDVASPDWSAAGAQFARCAQLADDPMHLEIIKLHQARVAVQLQKWDEVKALLNEVRSPLFEESKESVLSEMESPRSASGNNSLGPAE